MENFQPALILMTMFKGKSWVRKKNTEVKMDLSAESVNYKAFEWGGGEEGKGSLNIEIHLNLPFQILLPLPLSLGIYYLVHSGYLRMEQSVS